MAPGFMGKPFAVAGIAVALCAIVSCAPRPSASNVEDLAPDAAALLVDREELRSAPIEGFADVLATDPYNYFRFVNTQWAACVCDRFGGQLALSPSVRLHGDAHVTQYALTAQEHGLDDFDDSARGPAVLDFVRFLGSVELALRRRGWEGERERMFGEFLRGYGLAVENPGYLPPAPACVVRLRKLPVKSQLEFLAWAESLMEPYDEATFPELESGIAAVRKAVAERFPGLPPGFMNLKSVGWLRIGIGSALTLKNLGRFEGPTPDAGDDFILEAKELGDLSQVGCLSVPAGGETTRVLEGNQSLGRISHEIVVVAPDVRMEGRDWWVRTWERSYREVAVEDFESPDELAELIHDAGAQLGRGHYLLDGGPMEKGLRLKAFAALQRLQPRTSEFSVEMADALLAAWEVYRNAPRQTQ